MRLEQLPRVAFGFWPIKRSPVEPPATLMRLTCAQGCGSYAAIGSVC